MAKRVRVGKIDLDTCGVGYLLGVDRQDEVVVVRGGHATAEELANPAMICIEVGGTGQHALNNWDHHDIDDVTEEGLNGFRSATMQALWEERMDLLGKNHVPSIQLAFYIDALDCDGPAAVRREALEEGFVPAFPTLSDVFAGMLLAVKGPIEQFHQGVELLRSIIESEQSAYGTIHGFDVYAEAKRKNNAQVSAAVRNATWATTMRGRRMAAVETSVIGVPGKLYQLGAEIVVVYSPAYGEPPVPKYTVAGNGIAVTEALSALNNLEKGWGGPNTGTIIGSPRLGTRLNLNQVVEAVQHSC